jgi:hypothetical protein
MIGQIGQFGGDYFLSDSGPTILPNLPYVCDLGTNMMYEYRQPRKTQPTKQLASV